MAAILRPLFRSAWQSALSRHDSQSLADLIEQTAMVDGSIKGYASGNPWDRLERLVTDLCRV